MSITGYLIRINIPCSIPTKAIPATVPASGALFGICLVQAFNLLINRNLLRIFYNANGSLFAIGASLYYLLVYPIPVGVGIASGIAQFFARKGFRGSNRKVLD